MQTSQVYFTTFRTQMGVSTLDKMKKLILAAGWNGLDLHNKYTAIKIHFGEPGNLAFLRPNYAKVVVDMVKEGGGKPFLTDCNTLYTGRRKDALEHMEAAYENGFSPFSTGCHVIIADGLKGTDEALVPVKGEYVTEAKIGRAVMDADVVISLNHFKGHELTGFGGAIKNIGMGCGSRAGKMEMHCDGKPIVDPERCHSCGECKKICAQDAISFVNKKARINHDLCAGCGRCIGTCRFDAVEPGEDAAMEVMPKKMAEYALAVLQGRPAFHISLIMDVSPYCDCHAENDVPIVPDIGILASFDPIALDCACADLVNQQAPLPGSMLAEQAKHGDHFHTMHPITDWKVCMAHGEQLGIGCQAYELIRVE